MTGRKRQLSRTRRTEVGMDVVHHALGVKLALEVRDVPAGLAELDALDTATTLARAHLARLADKEHPR